MKREDKKLDYLKMLDWIDIEKMLEAKLRKEVEYRDNGDIVDATEWNNIKPIGKKVWEVIDLKKVPLPLALTVTNWEGDVECQGGYDLKTIEEYFFKGDRNYKFYLHIGIDDWQKTYIIEVKEEDGDIILEFYRESQVKLLEVKKGVFATYKHKEILVSYVSLKSVEVVIKHIIGEKYGI